MGFSADLKKKKAKLSLERSQRFAYNESSQSTPSLDDDSLDVDETSRPPVTN